MPGEHTAEPIARKPLRLWPGVIAAVLLVLVRLVMPFIVADVTPYAVLGALGCAVAIVLWWLLFSRALWSERLGAVAVMAVALLATSRIVDPSIANGMMGMMLPVFGIPVVSFALVCWAVAARRLTRRARLASMVATILLASGAFALLRTGGISGSGDADLHWRWTSTPEERLLAQVRDEPPAPAAAAAATAREEPASPVEGPTTLPAPPRSTTPTTVMPSAVRMRFDWPGFRGPHRDGIVHGVRIATDWSASPPGRLWQRPIGPGWSSFAVSGNVFYTQEQRGEEEIVACYKVATGEPVWMHRDTARFWESNGGAGPRATPTLDKGRVYTLGATGIVNALDARTGAVVWSRDGAKDTGASLPGWGFAGSPLVVDDLVVVALSGRLVAYDIATGAPRWFGPTGGGGGYSSPHLATIDGVPQILLLKGGGAASVAPGDGALLWEHSWEPAVSIVQPALTSDGDVLITGGGAMGGLGVRRLAVSHGATGWSVQERWTSRGLKPYFNDLVVHKGHAFGFDGSILACIDLADGARKWKGGRYGNGQLVLLPDQDLLLVLSEEGELALVGATPDQFTEVARVSALAGKTWNHPVLVGDVLLVRNGEEMAAFRLSLARE